MGQRHWPWRAEFGLECMVYMVKVSLRPEAVPAVMMETWGAEVVPSPTPDTAAGRGILEPDPESPGSLGIAISEAVEDAASATTPGTRWAAC